jgi:putative acetyltransferase
MLPDDLPETIAMWVAAWQAAYPAIDFAARRGWIAGRIAELERGGSQSHVMTHDGRIIGLLVVNPDTGYLDQLVVTTHYQGSGAADALLAEARQLSPVRLDLHVNKDNARAIRFYEKNGFRVFAEDINPRSGAPIYRMSWNASGTAEGEA